ncbi:hypothetical protein [Streptomyces halstedii]
MNDLFSIAADVLSVFGSMLGIALEICHARDNARRAIQERQDRQE